MTIRAKDATLRAIRRRAALQAWKVRKERARLAKRQGRCPIHRGYTGQRPPRVPCVPCQLLYESMHFYERFEQQAEMSR